MPDTNTLTLSDLQLQRSQSITLSYQEEAREWWAVLWDREARNAPAFAVQLIKAEDPLVALAELLVAMGHRPDALD